MGKITPLAIHSRAPDNPHRCLDNSVSEPIGANSNLNALCNSLIKKNNRKRFRAFPERYCRDYGLTLEEIHAVTDLDVVQLLKLGGGLPSLERLTSIYGLEILELCAQQTGKTLAEVKAFLDSF